MILRTWNVARRKEIREMVQLVSADRPAIVCMQEVPAKALAQAGAWSGMQALGDREERSLLGGSGSLVLGPPDATVLAHKTITLNTNVFCEEQARRLGLDEKQTRAWESPRRICQVVKLELPSRRRIVVANVHTTTSRDHRLVDAELHRAVNFVDRQLELGDMLVFTGWYELGGETSETISTLLGHERESRWYGLQSPFPMLLVLGAQIESVRTWPDEERTYGGKLLSSYPPVEAVLNPS